MNAERPSRPHQGAERVGEAERLATIARLGMTETATVATFEALVHALRLMLNVAAAYVVVIDTDSLKVWSGFGENTLWSVPRVGSFSEEVVRTGRSLVVGDARTDARFAGHPYVNGESGGMPFFVGIPLATSTGAVLGTLCGFDVDVRPPPDGETIRMLEELATTAVAELELKSANAELARQEQALLDRTEILEATFENITEGVTIFDGDLDLVAVNRKGAEILGIPPGAGSGSTAVDLEDAARAGFYGRGGTPAELLEMRAARLRTFLDTRPQPLRPDTEIELADGRTVRRRLRQMTDGFLTTYVDLTELRSRQAQLLSQGRYFELQHKLAMLCNSAPDMPAALRRVVDLNMRELNGTVGLVWREQGGGLATDGILRLADRPDLEGAAEHALAATLRRPSALALRCAASGRMTYATPDDPDRGDVSSLCPGEALLTGYAVPLRVLGERYVVEFYGPGGVEPKSWHKDIIRDLECQLDLVAERDRARRRKAEFISTVSHELRTPLTSMRGMLELLESGLFGELPGEAAALVEQASADSRVLGTSIEDVLAIHDIQHGDVPSDPRRGDLLTVLRAGTRSTGLELVADDHADLGAVFDEALLIRALDKLAAALDAPRRPARISVRRRGRTIRLVAEGRPDGRRDRGMGGSSVALRLASCLFERAGGSTADLSSAERTILQVDLPVEIVRLAKPVVPDEVARVLAASVPVAIPASPFASRDAGPIHVKAS